MDLTEYLPGWLKLPRWLIEWGERRLGFSNFNIAHDHIEEDWENGSTEDFFTLACKYLNLNYDLEGLENIPAEGPCVVVSNHPHGMSDGLMFGALAMRRRKDIRIVVNDFLYCVRGMRPYSITVNVYGGNDAKRANIAGMKEMLAWLREGHCLLVFPSGSVSSLSLRHREIQEDPWQANIAGIIAKTHAAVVPMHISGHTGWFFQLVTVLAKGIRPSFLPREIKRDGRMRHSIRLGRAVPATLLAHFKDPQSLIDHLRLRSSLLRYAAAPAPQDLAEPAAAAKPAPCPVDAPESPELLQEEIDALPESCQCVAGENGGLQVYAAEAEQIPRLLHEIGLQRENTFRAVGEGTGTACDLDRYDPHYIHLILWDPAARCLAGAYRIGRTDFIIRNKGLDGLYNAQFFHFGKPAMEVISKGLEMGRAFITRPYQRQAGSLDTLWQGIARYLLKHPEYRYLYGTVSISQDYTNYSRRLILGWLRAHCMNAGLARSVRANFPPVKLAMRAEDMPLLRTGLEDARLLNMMVVEAEPDRKGIPVLLRQYLRLNGKMLSFGIDEGFGGVLDCLVLLDLESTAERFLKRYMETPS
ncbi:MAG: lysophospholipid acyltransferase family protein [Akkermansia sp.]|nr:lysophospholipid acyltransferase family protein [Akkermansia sp.]